MTKACISILIADDHSVVRRGIRQILQDEPDMRIAAEASNAQEVQDALRRGKPDLVLLDITMPGKSGIELLKDLVLEHPKLRVLLLSMHPEGEFAVRSLKAGAAGYLMKDAAPEELVKAIRKVHGGGRYVSAAVAERLAFDLTAGGSKTLDDNLSAREFEVLCLLGAGKTVSQAASAMSISVKTVSTYRARLLEKLKLKTTAELMRYAIRHRLVE